MKFFRLWNIRGDDFSLEDNRIFQIASLSLDELEVFFYQDEQTWFTYFFFCFSFARFCFFYNYLSWFLLDHKV